MLSLPLQPAALIGRATELAELTDLFLDRRARLVSLTGTGGTGKTRLAIAVAEAVAPGFPAGVCLVDLTTVPRGAVDQVWNATAHALGLADDLERDPFELVRDFLQGLKLLLLYDNFEHVLEAATAVSRLLDQCPDVQALATSREPLRLRWEITYAVPPLDVTPAVALFEERARAVEPRFTLDAATLPVVAELCERLDRLPLAIELAAARSRVLTPRAILARLEGRLSLLTTSVADIPERHQTLRATMAWSYELLEAADQQLFRTLAVFAGSFTADAVTALLGAPTDEDQLDILDGLTRLAERSLLRVDAEGGLEPRFSMLNTLREYALEQLRDEGEYPQSSRQHALYYLELVERAEQAQPGMGESAWLGRLEDDYENVRTALYWALGESDPSAIDIALRLSGGLWRFWWVRGYVNEGTRLLRAALGRAATAAPASRAKALHGAGKLARERGDLEEAEEWCRQALETVREIGDQQAEALVLNSLGNIVGDRSDYAGAAELYSESLELRRALGDRPGAALALHNLAAVARSAGDLARASKLCAESLELARAAGDRWGIAIGLGLEARLALSRGDPGQAQPLCAESLELRQQLGDRQGIIRCLEIMVEIALRTGKMDRAARLLGAVEALRTETGIGLPLDERADYDRKVASVRERLGEPRTSLAWAEGQGMDAHRAIAYATSTAPEPVAMPRPTRNADPLSQRELEVARLVARGLTNRQIADELIISKWTADNHVGNILRKLELIGRAQVAAWLAERGLLEAELDAAAAGTNG